MSRAIIYDVAARAGVSIKTVSRVMNQEQNVSEATRQKVVEAAAALNYRPSLSARGLAGHRSYLIALLYDNPSGSYLADMQTGILDTCHAEGFGMMLQPVDSTADTLMADVEQILQANRLDGIILTPPICDRADLIARLAEKGTLTVSIAPPSPDAANSVVIDDRRAAKEMTDYLIGLGHRRIAFIKGHPTHGAGRRRLDGYLDALAAAGLPRDEELIQQGYFSFATGAECAEKLLDLPAPPTAIFAGNDDMAAGAIHVALDRGLRVPDDLSVAGFDDTPLSHMIWPSLTTVHQPIHDMGQRAAEMLIGRIRQGEETAAAELPFSLVIRGSCTAPA